MARDALVEQAQGGERQALAGLVERHQGKVYSLALAITRNPTDAADMTQETFVRMLRSVGTYRGTEASFATWLHRLTVNVCVDAMRRNRRAPISLDTTNEDEVKQEPVSHDHWVEPEWRAEYRESATEVRAALRELPLAQRIALSLHYFEGSSYDQIAAVMQLPINTVKSHLLRGKQRMARLLAAPATPAAHRARPAAQRMGNLRLSFSAA
jgi:RNA polymerase sigma-70 factor (ECF subfamily)